MKKVVGVVLVAVVLLLALPWSGLAGHSNTRYFFGFNVGVGGPGYYGPPAWGPRPYWGPPMVVAPPYPYYAPPAVVVQQPPVYVRQPQPEEPDYWYYCENPRGYYPYVRTCPGGWMKVVPQTVPPSE